MSASSRCDGDTTATLAASGCAPPTPSTCSGWPLPITASSSASRSPGSSGRSAARKYRPLAVPPRISMHRTPAWLNPAAPGQVGVVVPHVLLRHQAFHRPALHAEHVGDVQQHLRLEVALLGLMR